MCVVILLNYYIKADFNTQSSYAVIIDLDQKYSLTVV